MLNRLLVMISLICAAPVASAAPCGRSFEAFVTTVKQEARAMGYSKAVTEGFFENVQQSARVLKSDRSQSVLHRPFIDFSSLLISDNRMQRAKGYYASLDPLFSQIEKTYGVPRALLLAFWAFETDFGDYQGDHNTRDALTTLAHDCRRPELFGPQLFAAIELYSRGDFDPLTTQGAWAGEIGMVQMLPRDIIENATDGDGDGRISLQTSRADALWSAAKMLRHEGWRPNEPWLQEVRVPDHMDWAQTGLYTKRPVSTWHKMGVRPRSGEFEMPRAEASILLPHGRNGPAFIAYPNFDVFFEWNQSFNYVLTAAYFSTLINGAPAMDTGAPSAALDTPQIKALQAYFENRGIDAGGVDGVIGRNTRQAIRQTQQSVGLPADGWPDAALLRKLGL